jgi:hypothetical protein
MYKEGVLRTKSFAGVWGVPTNSNLLAAAGGETLETLQNTL